MAHRYRSAKRDPLYRSETVVLSQMSVNAHRQSSAVLVSEPSAYRGYIHSGFNTGSRKEMPKS